MRRDDSSPEAYREAVQGEQREMLETIRKAILRVAPGAEETTKYGMLNYPGLGSLAAQKHYVSLYVSPTVLAKHKKRFPGVDSGKSCLRFKRLDQIDAKALALLLRDVDKLGEEC